MFLCPDVPSEGQERWMPSLLHAVSNVFQNASANPDPYHQLPDCSYFTTTPYAVQFTCGGVDVDIMISFDWNSRESGGANAIYDVSCKQTTRSGRRWCVRPFYITRILFLPLFSLPFAYPLMRYVLFVSYLYLSRILCHTLAL